MNALLLPNNLSYLKEYIKYFKILHRMKTMLTDTKHMHKILSQLKSTAKLSQTLVDKGFLHIYCVSQGSTEVISWFHCRKLAISSTETLTGYPLKTKNFILLED